jgi:hypothetical protein
VRVSNTVTNMLALILLGMNGWLYFYLISCPTHIKVQFALAEHIHVQYTMYCFDIRKISLLDMQLICR